MRKELLLGCGNSRIKRLWFEGAKEFENLTTLDIDPSCNPDIVWDLDMVTLPFADEEFDEIHAYEVLEHTGNQGDWQFFFDQFMEFWRILKPDGLLFITVPNFNSMWAWGDPGHTRSFCVGTFAFLEQDVYKNEVGTSTMTDYRAYWKKDFKRLLVQPVGNPGLESLQVILQKQ